MSTPIDWTSFCVPSTVFAWDVFWLFFRGITNFLSVRSKSASVLKENSFKSYQIMQSLCAQQPTPEFVCWRMSAQAASLSQQRMPEKLCSNYDRTESVGERCSRHGLTFQPVTNERRANYISALIWNQNTAQKWGRCSRCCSDSNLWDCCSSRYKS